MVLDEVVVSGVVVPADVVVELLVVAVAAVVTLVSDAFEHPPVT